MSVSKREFSIDRIARGRMLAEREALEKGRMANFAAGVMNAPGAIKQKWGQFKDDVGDARARGQAERQFNQLNNTSGLTDAAGNPITDAQGFADQVVQDRKDQRATTNLQGAQATLAGGAGAGGAGAGGAGAAPAAGAPRLNTIPDAPSRISHPPGPAR